MNNSKPESRIQVIDRAASLLDAMGRYSTPVRLKVLSADTELHPSTAHRILHSLISNRFVDRDPNGDYQLAPRLQQRSPGCRSDIDLRAVALPVMEALRDRLEETVNLCIREGDVVIYFEKVTPKRMMHVHQIVGSRAPLHVTAVGKLMLGMAGEDAIRDYAKRTNLPAYTRNTYSQLPALIEECLSSVRQRYALDNEEAEIDVGCIGVLLRDGHKTVTAGLSISAPIERRRSAWVKDMLAAAEAVSTRLGCPPG